MSMPGTSPFPLNDDAAHQSRGVFLHTGWRSAGTWVWSRFRALDSVTAFYEPLSNVIADLKLADLAALKPTFNSGHPALNAPYFAEYRPFMREGARGVPGYRRRFSIDRFGDTPDMEFPALHAYLHELTVRTLDAGKMPVFKFCRSSGRLPWLKQAFPAALHVAVMRNPASQFASGWLLQQEWRNTFFVAAPLRVLGLNRREPIVKAVIDACEVRLPDDSSASEDAYAAVCEQYARTIEGAHAYRAFIALWALCALRIANAADIVLDIDRLGNEPAYAAESAAGFAARSGVTPRFDDARDLVDELKRTPARIAGIDGWSMRTVHNAVVKFIEAHVASPQSEQSAQSAHTPDVAALVREKLALAAAISEPWR
ncbi:hypothetical protein [Paraburkholderia rhizosphaerae]|jgi:hypothetical protein|uniref:Sulfotransferase family protein n=1 Tax=Paraburkholderia rhizosphaerae TaxID=480658 RepID=A0A4R8M4E6_9BURK|nr:hypothetical protein [Paraburkholderia rhizosphaerae]TDY54712.1 hypothetical protein BX592_101168 [Paraburkholderia rhizosphaerae]